MIVYHVAITAAADYVTRREAHRRAHIERIAGLREHGRVIGGGPAPDGATADLFYRVELPAELAEIIENDPYWRGGVWTHYEPRSFSEFVEPWQPPAIVLDGSRRVTLVEGPASDRDMAQFALVEMRGASRVAFGGFFEDGTTLALANTPDADTAAGWFRDTGFWGADRLSTRPLLHVL